MCSLLLGVRSTSVLPQWHVKDPGHSAKSAGGRLHVNTYTPLTQRSRSGLTMPLSKHSVGTYLETSSDATCQGTFGHSRLSSLSHCGLILEQRVVLLCARANLHFKKKKKAHAGSESSNILPKSLHARKKPPPTLDSLLSPCLDPDLSILSTNLPPPPPSLPNCNQPLSPCHISNVLKVCMLVWAVSS